MRGWSRGPKRAHREVAVMIGMPGSYGKGHLHTVEGVHERGKTRTPTMEVFWVRSKEV